LLVKLHNIFVNNKMDIEDEEPRHQIIARQIRAIMAELDKRKSESLPVSSIKSMPTSVEKPLSSSSVRQQGIGIDPDDRRIISPGNLGAVTGETQETIRSTIIEILDVNNRNHIKKLKHLAKLLYKIKYFEQYKFSYIYKILVWIALRILIDSKKATLVGYDEYKEEVYEQIESDPDDPRKNSVIDFLKTKKPFYRIIDYYQLFYLFSAYTGVLRLQEAKQKKNKKANDIHEMVIDQTEITHSKTVSLLTVLSSYLINSRLIDRRIFNKIQKAINKLRAKDTTKK
jgi:hypothetical protein